MKKVAGLFADWPKKLAFDKMVKKFQKDNPDVKIEQDDLDPDGFVDVRSTPEQTKLIYNKLSWTIKRFTGVSMEINSMEKEVGNTTISPQVLQKIAQADRTQRAGRQPIWPVPAGNLGQILSKDWR